MIDYYKVKFVMTGQCGVITTHNTMIISKSSNLCCKDNFYLKQKMLYLPNFSFNNNLILNSLLIIDKIFLFAAYCTKPSMLCIVWCYIMEILL